MTATGSVDNAAPLRLYNTLGRRLEIFTPLTPGRVLMYSCGPTVYHFTHIGNIRSFLMADVLRRVLEYNGYQVTHVKNITDVGHLRDDVAGTGADRIELAAREEGRTPQQIAEFYTDQYLVDERRLNMLEPQARPRATQYIPQMLDLAQTLLDSGFAYPAEGNVYFDVSKFPTYGALSGNRLEDLVAGQRVDIEPDKRNPADFALWKAGDPGRLMNWDSPWGPGFPGWHIECSAMATALLGEQIDIHTGGVDNLFPHHEDERAQSEAAHGKQFARYWIHGAHLLFGDEKMSKSLKNITTLSDLIAQGIHPLTYRFYLLQGHYRKQLAISESSLEAAQTGLDRIWDQIAELVQSDPGEADPCADDFKRRFTEAINDDLGTPKVLALLQEVLDSSLSPNAKLDILGDMDRVLALDLIETAENRSTLTPEHRELVKDRQEARDANDWARSDALRAQLAQMGVDIRDTAAGQRWVRRSHR